VFRVEGMSCSATRRFNIHLHMRTALDSVLNHLTDPHVCLIVLDEVGLFIARCFVLSVKKFQVI
jgi:hypothetical protein